MKASIDYAHVHKLYAWATNPKGGGWFLIPTPAFAVLAGICFIGFVVVHYWEILLVAGFFYGAWEKRRGLKEGFVLGYEAGHDEAGLGPSPSPSST
jgi:hypothetical protein